MARISEAASQNEGAGSRPCLKCHKSFFSDGYGNRLCGKCNMDNISLSRLDRTRVYEAADGQVIRKKIGSKQ